MVPPTDYQAVSGMLEGAHHFVMPEGGRAHHEDFTVQQLETGIYSLDQPGQITGGEATG